MRQEFLELTALWQGLLPDRVLRAGLEDNGQSKISSVYEGFSGRKRVSTPTVAMPAGVVTLLRGRCGYLCCARALGENP
jgi:hypothetical protein